MNSCECEQVIETDTGLEYVNEVVQAAPLDLTQTDFDVTPTVIEVIERGLQGRPGDAASISTDKPNAIRLGKDGKMLVDDVLTTDCNTDFSIIYQLSK